MLFFDKNINSFIFSNEKQTFLNVIKNEKKKMEFRDSSTVQCCQISKDGASNTNCLKLIDR